MPYFWGMSKCAKVEIVWECELKAEKALKYKEMYKGCAIVHHIPSNSTILKFQLKLFFPIHIFLKLVECCYTPLIHFLCNKKDQYF